jgi:hypothetical protein
MRGCPIGSAHGMRNAAACDPGVRHQNRLLQRQRGDAGESRGSARGACLPVAVADARRGLYPVIPPAAGRGFPWPPPEPA